MWQDWINFFLGLWLAASPWLMVSSANRTEIMMANCLISGLLIAGLSLWEAYSERGTWQDWIVLLLCIWLFVASGTLRYGVSRIAWDNVIIGIAAGIFALVSLKRHKMIARTT